MSKTVIQFIKSHGRYNAGEIAGFEPVQAKKFCDQGLAQPATDTALSIANKTLSLDVGTQEAKALVKDAKAEFEVVANQQAEHQAKLDAREQELLAREVALAKDEPKPKSDPLVEKPAGGKSAPNPAPKQGVKA